jgi:hypothetical protein
MTPEQKADHLINEMKLGMSEQFDFLIASQCALLAVSEIVKALFQADEMDEDCLDYWIYVKYEIINRMQVKHKIINN